MGGGPAGLTAGVYASFLRMNTFLISENIGGQPVDSSKIVNYMGVPSDIEKAEDLYEEAKKTYADGTYAHTSPKLSDVIDLFEEAWEKAVGSY